MSHDVDGNLEAYIRGDDGVFTKTDQGSLSGNRQLTAFRYSGCNLDPLESHGLALAEIPRGAHVLDVGCGTGHFGAALLEKGCCVTGVEPNPARAATAEELGLRVFRGFLSTRVLAEIGPQDFVVFMDVLEHCEDPIPLLQLGRAALRPSGKIIVSLPNVAHWSVRMRLLFGRFDYSDTGLMDFTHLRWYTRKTILTLLSAAELDPLRLDVSRGYWLGEYKRAPLRWVPRSWLRVLVDHGCRRFPGLFGTQHFVVCKPRG